MKIRGEEKRSFNLRRVGGGGNRRHKRARGEGGVNSLQEELVLSSWNHRKSSASHPEKKEPRNERRSPTFKLISKFLFQLQPLQQFLKIKGRLRLQNRPTKANKRGKRNKRDGGKTERSPVSRLQVEQQKTSSCSQDAA